jgi:membrane dipeptidase
LLGGLYLLALAAGCSAGARPDEPLAAAEDPVFAARAARLHRDAILVDGHNDVTTFILDYGFDLGMDGSGADKRDATLYWVRGLHWLLPEPKPEELRMDTDLRRLRAGGVDALFFAIFVDSSFVPEDPSEAGKARGRALDMIEALKAQIDRHRDALELARSAADVRRIVADGRIAALMGLEGGHAIEDDLEFLRDFQRRGIRYMTLTWSNANDWADSCYEERHGGLTERGREVVQEMNRLGILVDISHVSDATFWDAIEVSRAPVIASHSSVRAISDHPRNLSDDMLRAIAANGGVAMINFSEFFIDPAKNGTGNVLLTVLTHLGWPHTPFEFIVDHIDHAVEVAGIDHVGLGSDFAGTFSMPGGMKDVTGFPRLTTELLRRGYAPDAVRKVLGENTLRVMGEAETIARRLQAEPGVRPPAF